MARVRAQNAALAAMTDALALARRELAAQRAEAARLQRHTTALQQAHAAHVRRSAPPTPREAPIAAAHAYAHAHRSAPASPRAACPVMEAAGSAAAGGVLAGTAWRAAASLPGADSGAMLGRGVPGGDGGVNWDSTDGGGVHQP